MGKALEYNLRLAPARMDVERRADGAMVLRSPQLLGRHARAIGEWLVRWAREAPERTFLAERHGEDWRKVSYREALDLVRRVGQGLLDRGLAAATPIAILSDNSLDHALLALGAMHVGVPVAPVSPAYSLMSKDFAKLKAIFALLHPGLVWTSDPGKFAPALAAVGARPTPFAELLAAEATPEVDAAFARIGPDTVAKILFTSGSTGEPKGVLGRHGPITHFDPWLQRTFGFCETDRFSMVSALTHDPLHRDIFTPLQAGASVFIPDPDEIMIPDRLAEWMEKEHITVANLTPAMGRLLTEPAPGGSFNQITSLRYIFLVGDVLTRRDVARLQKLFPLATCVNFYGATETQRALSYFIAPNDAPAFESNHSEHGKEVIPLGRGIKDVQLLVLSSAHQLAGVGELGEIFIHSPHLAKGYLNDETLSRERFIINPFTKREGDRLYKTGDLGRYLPSGEVEPLGRADRQIKVRGFRVEPEEIEATLEKHPSVDRALIIPSESATHDKRLIAYIVPNYDGAQASDNLPLSFSREQRSSLDKELRRYLREHLPLYMIPSSFVMIAEIPLTPNRKVDRRSLPPPDESPSNEPDNYVAPNTPIEEIVAAIWSSVLGVKRVGISDNFFALGGHSLLATRVISRVKGAFDVELPVRRMFEFPTVAGIAESIESIMEEGKRSPAPALKPVTRGWDLPLSFSQQRLWFLDKLEPDNPFYNIGTAVRLIGLLDAAAFARSFQEVINRHGILRTAFIEIDGQPRQLIAEAVDAPVVIEDLRSLPAAEREAKAQHLINEEMKRPFDLTRAPLLRLKLLKLDEQEHVVIAAMHHIVSDGWSNEIFIREMSALYEAFSSSKEPQLTPLPVQYADFAAWQRAWLQAEMLERELAYWKEVLSGAPAVLELPADRPRPAALSFKGSRYHFALSESVSKNPRSSK